MKRRKKQTEKEGYIKICPKCGSMDIKIDFSNPVVWDFGTTSKYKCGDCGHIANTFPEVLFNEIEEFRNELRQEIKEGKVKQDKEELVDTSPGFIVGIFEVSLLLIASIMLFYINITSNEPYSSTIALFVWIFALAFVMWKIVRRRKINPNYP